MSKRKFVVFLVTLVTLVALEVTALIAYYGMHDATTSRILMRIVLVGVLSYDVGAQIVDKIRIRRINK